MTLTQLALASVSFYRRTYIAVVFGVSAAVAVLAGSLLVGSSVRSSLASLATAQLGRTEVVVGTELPFTDALAGRLAAQAGLEGAAIAPLFSLRGVVQHQASRLRAGNVAVYGIDDRFFALHGVSATAPDDDRVLFSADLAAELDAASGDTILIRVARPTDIPVDSLHGRKEDVGRTLRLTAGGTLPATAMGEFSLEPRQGPVRAAFVSLARAQRDLGQEGRVNTLLLAGTSTPVTTVPVRESLTQALLPADIGLTITVDEDAGAVLVESTAGLIPEAVADPIAAFARAEGLDVTPVLSWLATTISGNDRDVPYSLVTAIGPAGDDDSPLRRLDPTAAPPGIVLNRWTADNLGVGVGASIELEYQRWADEGRLVTERTTFQLTGIVPMTGLAGDRRLAPDYPGISDTRSFADWDPPFPIDLSRVRPADEAYWDTYRTTPKAFVALETGQALWRTRYGQVTSLRIQPGDATDLATVADRLRVVTSQIGPLRAGFNVVDIRAQTQNASVGATDFGEYFSYFSFFLMVSALLLAALFFRLSIEQRLPEIGVLRSAGFRLSTIRRLFLLEGTLISTVGGGLGMGLAVAWAGLMMYGLRTWWSGAVGTTRLTLHVDPIALIGGSLAGLAAAVLSILLTIHQLNRLTPRQLLTGSRDATVAASTARRGRGLAIGCLAAAAFLSALSVGGVMPAAGGYFGAGGLVLVGGLAAFRAWLTRQPDPAATPGPASIAQLGVRNASWRPGRSLTAAGLVASAVFLLVSVDSFRKGSVNQAGPASGTGGFALIAEAALPLVHDPSTLSGRDALGLQFQADDPDLAGVEIYPARLRTGDDASCLNLYRPQRPRVLGIPTALIDANRFTFGATLATSDEEAANPWRLLGSADAEGAVPAIADQTSLAYVLHAGVGDVITIDEDTSRPIRLRIVAALSDSVLQGEIAIAETAFRQLFPDEAGYRVLLIDVADGSPDRLSTVASVMEDRMESFGVDVQETARRLEAFHRVENTYLSTFQALGGLGLVLGCLGLSAVIARNVLERRRELALLGATGFSGRALQTLVIAENLTLVGAGLGIGLAAAAVAIGPVLLSRGSPPPLLPLAWLLLVAAVGLLSSVAATGSVRRLALVPSLRSE